MCTNSGIVDDLLGTNIGSAGKNDKLSVLFGSISPFLSFASLAGLGDHEDGFRSLPQDASVMIFELFSNVTDSTDMPSIDDLWVRFLFRNGSDIDAPMIAYPLFRRGNTQTDMQWVDFVNEMKGIQVEDVGAWCKMCNSSSVLCDRSSDDDTISNSHPKGLTPLIAGVIGYAVAVAVLMISLLAAVLFRVLRLRYNRRSSLTGFNDLKNEGNFKPIFQGPQASFEKQEM
jgi:hypothetical protein